MEAAFPFVTKNKQYLSTNHSKNTFSTVEHRGILAGNEDHMEAASDDCAFWASEKRHNGASGPVSSCNDLRNLSRVGIRLPGTCTDQKFVNVHVNIRQW